MDIGQKKGLVDSRFGCNHQLIGAVYKLAKYTGILSTTKSFGVLVFLVRQSQAISPWMILLTTGNNLFSLVHLDMIFYSLRNRQNPPFSLKSWLRFTGTNILWYNACDILESKFVLVVQKKYGLYMPPRHMTRTKCTRVLNWLKKESKW